MDAVQAHPSLGNGVLQRQESQLLCLLQKRQLLLLQQHVLRCTGLLPLQLWRQLEGQQVQRRRGCQHGSMRRACRHWCLHLSSRLLPGLQRLVLLLLPLLQELLGPLAVRVTAAVTMAAADALAALLGWPARAARG